MKKISSERFNKLVHTKQIHGKQDAFITWDGFDMFQLADTKEEAKENLFNRINTGWEDKNKENQEQD